MSDRLQPESKRGGGGKGTPPPPPQGSENVESRPGGFRRGRRAFSSDTVGREFAASDPTMQLLYPAIADYLTRRLVDGKIIDTATLLLFAEEGQFKLCLSDRDGGVVVFRAGKTVEEALGSLESCLIDGSADWREKRPQKGR